MSEAALNWLMPMPVESTYRPLAHVAVRDDDDRSRFVRTLRNLGFAVVEARSGYHLLSRMAENLCGEHTWMEPTLIVVDAYSPGCSGVTIAQGLRDLGRKTAVVLIARDAEQLARVEGAAVGVHATVRDQALPLIRSVARFLLRGTGSGAEGVENETVSDDSDDVFWPTAFPSARLMA